MRQMAQPLPHLEQARQHLERHFGLPQFRPGQAEVISLVLSGKNVVVVMPTGAGKSLCYQLPALLLPGITLVVSPLVSLMKDQVEQLLERGISATFINSTLNDAERALRMQRLRAGEYRLLYVAPERFRSPAFLEALGHVGVDLFAVDEAHCISQWGHDFRPDYAFLGKVRKRLRPPKTVALTATATPEVREDIVRSLLMKDPQIFVAGFDRPNLFLEVVKVSGDEERKHACAQLMEEGGSGIIYCSTRKAADGLHKSLKSSGKSTVLYHAGLDDDARHRAQDQFMENDEAVAIATNAFGMGIDKPDIRFVVHAHIPRAVESYYQEIGRGGRDGQKARAILLFNHADVYTQERLIESSHPPLSVFADIWEALQEVEEFDRGVASLAGAIGSNEFEVSAALRILEREGKVVRGGRGEGLYQIELKPKAKVAHPASAQAQTLLSALKANAGSAATLGTTLFALRGRTGLSEDEIRHALSLLEKAGAISVRRPFSGRAIRALERVPFAALELDLSRVREQERRAALLLRRMTDYAYTPKCRRAFLLRYFGEEDVPSQCGQCDSCGGPRLKIQSPRRGAVAAGPEPLPHSELAAASLRKFRRELSKDLGLPPFVLFNDATLFAFATALPIDRESFLQVKGAGPSSWERFGPKVVEVSLMARAAGHVPSAVPKAKSRRVSHG